MQASKSYTPAPIRSALGTCRKEFFLLSKALYRTVLFGEMHLGVSPKDTYRRFALCEEHARLVAFLDWPSI